MTFNLFAVFKQYLDRRASRRETKRRLEAVTPYVYCRSGRHVVHRSHASWDYAKREYVCHACVAFALRERSFREVA